MNKTYCFFFTRSTEPREPELFFSSLRKYLQKTCPSKFAENDDETFLFTEEHLPLFIDLWWKGILHWWSGIFDADDRKSYGSAFLGTTHEDTDIVHIFETSLGTQEECQMFLIDLSKQLRVDYAFIHVLPDDTSTRSIDEMLGGATAKGLRRCLPGIPWAACYGKLYIDFFGKDKLLSLPIQKTAEINSDLVYCQLTEHLMDCIENTSLIDERRKPVYDLLGRDAFFDPQHPKQQGLAPEFKKPVVVRPQIR